MPRLVLGWVGDKLWERLQVAENHKIFTRSLSENIYGRKTGGDKSRYNIWLRCPVGKIDTNLPPLKNTVGENSILNFLHSVFRHTPRERVEGFWLPTLDIEEDKDNFTVKVELPGMKKEEIKLSLSGETLTISGERKHESEEKNKTYYRLERAYGRFQRTVSLPAEVDANRTRATYRDGILTLTMPKSARAKAKEIAIEVK